MGVEVDAVIQGGAFVSVDAAEVLSTFMVNDRPDPIRFFEAFGKLIASVTMAATAQRPRVAVFGEAVALLSAEGNVEAAIQLEKLGSVLAKTHEVDILCAYPISLHALIVDVGTMSHFPGYPTPSKARQSTPDRDLRNHGR